MKPISVNEALDRAVHLRGECVLITGTLGFGTGVPFLAHWPKDHRRGSRCEISLLEAGRAFNFNMPVLERWVGKRVVVLGELSVWMEGQTAELNYDWLSDVSETVVIARRVDLLKKWLRDHPEVDLA